MKILAIKPQLTPLSTFWNEDAQTLRIPTIQRQFVWDAEDVRDLIDSIVNGYPIGAIIIWEPTTPFPSAPLIGKDDGDNQSPRSRPYALPGSVATRSAENHRPSMMEVNAEWNDRRGRFGRRSGKNAVKKKSMKPFT